MAADSAVSLSKNVFIECNAALRRKDVPHFPGSSEGKHSATQVLLALCLLSPAQASALGFAVQRATAPTLPSPAGQVSGFWKLTWNQLSMISETAF